MVELANQELDFHTRENWFADVVKSKLLGDVEIVGTFSHSAPRRSGQKVLRDRSSSLISLCHVFDDGSFLYQGEYYERGFGGSPVRVPLPRSREYADKERRGGK